MDLAAAGWSSDACLDFDLAVVAFGDWVDGRREEVEEVADHRPAPSGRVRVVPRYRTLADLLGLDEAGLTGSDPATLDHIAAAFLAGEDL
jgi:hypothetical protein